MRRVKRLSASVEITCRYTYQTLVRAQRGIRFKSPSELASVTVLPRSYLHVLNI